MTPSMAFFLLQLVAMMPSLFVSSGICRACFRMAVLIASPLPSATLIGTQEAVMPVCDHVIA